mgnify:FL=1
MAWLEITVNTKPGGVETLATALTGLGFEDFCIEDQQEFESFLEENREYWDYIDEGLQQELQGLSRIKLYIEDTDTGSLETLRRFSKDRGLSMTEKLLPDTDWSESWKESYPPQEVGLDLVVLPYWLADTYEGDRKPVILDPGLTFGTGAHPSTQMVMETMEETLIPGSRCLDLGSGSGILSITALRLGAQEALGVDIDPKAEDIARENAAYNGFAAPAFTALTGNVTADKGLMERLSQKEYGLVLVNIVADVIIGLSPVLPEFLGEDTVLICSGILDNRLPEVLEALQQAGLSVTGIREKEEWRCVTARRASL